MANRGVVPSLTLGLPERSGFLIPAITVWVAIVVNLAALKRKTGVTGLLAILESQHLVSLVGLTLLAIYSIFLLGHVLDLLSNGISERFLSNKLDGYPHERIVPVRYTTRFYSRLKYRKETNLRRLSFFFEGAKLLVSGVTSLVLIGILLRNPSISPTLRTVLTYGLYYAAFAVFVSVVFALPAVLVRYLPYRTPTERRNIGNRVASRISKLFRRNRILSYVDMLWLGLVFVALGPFIYGYDLVDRLVRGLVRLNVEIDQNTFFRFIEAYRRRFGTDFSSVSNNDRFWLPYLDIHRELPLLARKVDEIRRFANFCRNQSFAFFLASLLVAGIYRSDTPEPIGIYTRSDLNTLAVALFALGWLFHWKFLHHYYSFTKMTFRVFSTLAPAEAAKPNQRKKNSELGTSE